MKTKMCVLVLLVMLVCANSTFAAWDYFNGNNGQNWSTDTSWSLGHAPYAGDYAQISHNDAVIIDGEAAACTGFYLGTRVVAGVTSSALEVKSGSLAVSSTAMIGSLMPATVTVSGGQVSFNGLTYLGYNTGNNVTLEITGGKVSTKQLQMGRVAGITTNVNIYDNGTLEVNTNANGFYFGAGGGTVDIKGDGVLKWIGDHTLALDWYRDEKGYIVTTEAGKTVGNSVYDEVTGYTTMQVVPEPMTMAILGLGGLFLARRKK